MEIKLGTLNFVVAKDNPEMLAAPVARALAGLQLYILRTWMILA